MNQQTMPKITLFDLLARNWQRPAAVRHLCFNGDDTLLAVTCEDGSVAFARIADNEPPDARITVDKGQTTIRPREGKPAPLIITRLKGAGPACAGEDGGFLARNEKGELVRLSRAGEIADTIFSADEPVVAFDHNRATGLTAIIAGDRLHLRQAAGGAVAEIDLAGEAADHIAFSADGTMLALAGAGDLSLRRSGEASKPFLQIPLPALALSLKWSREGRWLALGLDGAGLLLVEVGSGRHVTLGDFPGQVASLDWSAPANALLAAGAYRIVGWSMETPPFGNSAAGALETGHPGLVLVQAVATQPNGPLAAAGYANGQVVVAPVGSREELVVRTAGGPVTALRWSGDGRHLALGDALGNAAVVSFPRQLFK